jgi:hypothetical protein
MRSCTFVVPPPPLKGVVRDYAGGLGFEGACSYVLPPLDLLQLAAIAERVADVDLVDFSFGRPSSIDAADHFGCSLSGRAFVVQVSLPTLHHDIKFARLLRARGARVLQRVPYIAPQSVSTLEPDDQDEWLIGECEGVMCDVLEGKHEPSALRPDAPPPPRPVDLDSLPYPLRRLTRGLPYHFPRLGPCATLLSSRGCPFPCGYYCPYPLAQGSRWRARTAESVIDEIRHIVDDRLATNILFRDAVFTLDEARAQQICQGLRQMKLSVRFWCETRADLLAENTVRELAAAGCVGVNIGVETGDERLRLQQLKSGVTDELLIATRERLRRHGIQVSLLMMVGWPTETRESLVRTGALIARLRPRSVGLAFPTAYPGTDFHRQVTAAQTGESFRLPTSGEEPHVASHHLQPKEMIDARKLLMDLADAASEDGRAEELEARLQCLLDWAAGPR